MESYEREIVAGFEAAFHFPSDAERLSWRNSIPELAKVLNDPRFDSLQLILELQMPVGAERADAVLLGGTSEEPKAVVLELKQWSNINILPETNEVVVPGLDIHQHPSLQAANYAGKLHLFNAKAHTYNIVPAAYLHNAHPGDKLELSTGPGEEWVKSAPIFIRGDAQELADFINGNLLPYQLPDDEHRKFANAPYEQSSHLFSFLSQHADDIAKEATLTLANSGMGLTSEQERLKNEILLALSEGKKKDFIIQGTPGSGKTLLAVSLLLQAAERNHSCILALRNNRLQAILQRIFNQAYPGADWPDDVFRTSPGAWDCPL